MVEISSELRLVAACVRPLADERRLDAIRHAASVPFDAQQVVTLAHRHRVEGFVEQGLTAAGVELPALAAKRLATNAVAARLKTLRSAGEEVRVGQAFAAAGIDAIFIKGATLGMRAHGTTALKTSWDVDVLVARDQLDAAGAVLRDLGYRLTILGGIEDPIKVRRYLAAHKESEWRHEGRDTVVELHTELADNTAAIPTIGLGSPREMVELAPGVSLETLATAPLLAYLCYHGSVHLWERLKWLADVAALLQSVNISIFCDEAVILGADRPIGAAVLLSQELLGVRFDPYMIKTFTNNNTLTIYNRSFDAIKANDCQRKQLERPSKELLSYFRTQLLLSERLYYKFGLVKKVFLLPYIPKHLSVPRFLLPLIILLGIPVRLMLGPRQR